MKYKGLIYLIACLNAVDGLATYTGLSFQIIEESNPMMLSLWNFHPLLFLFCKIFFSFLLIFILLHSKIKQPFRKKISPILLITSIIYFVIFCLHLFWIIVYFFFF